MAVKGVEHLVAMLKELEQRRRARSSIAFFPILSICLSKLTCLFPILWRYPAHAGFIIYDVKFSVLRGSVTRGPSRWYVKIPAWLCPVFGMHLFRKVASDLPREVRSVLPRRSVAVFNLLNLILWNVSNAVTERYSIFVNAHASW